MTRVREFTTGWGEPFIQTWRERERETLVGAATRSRRNYPKFRPFDLLGGPNHGGTGLFSAGLILAVMVIPYIAAITFDVCRAVPRSQREGSLALGSTRWQMIRFVVLPYARPGIIAACFLALGRAIGETMAVAMLMDRAIRFVLLADALRRREARQNFGERERHACALRGSKPRPEEP